MQDQEGKQNSTRRESFGRTLLNDLNSGIHRSWKQDWQDLYAFYFDEESRRRLEKMGRVRRAFTIFAWLLKECFFKLTPPRRLLVVFAVILFLFGTSFDLNTRPINISVHPGILSFLVLLLVLMLELKDKLEAHDELEVGREVQKAILPQDNPVFPGWEIWMYTRPANNVGGDMVDYLFVTPDRLAVVLGDVAGKGLGAALLMAKLQATIRAVVAETANLAALGAKINAIMHRDGVAGRFATLAHLEPVAGEGAVRLLNAGHPPPLIRRRDGRVETLEPAAPPIGILPQAEFIEQRVIMEPGELMLVYSDGLSEAVDEKGEFFGDEQVEALVGRLGEVGAQEAGLRILAEVERFSGHARPHDDLSLILLRRRTH